jgi:DNA-directed RNA polymerase specialized sigma54-like protein
MVVQIVDSTSRARARRYEKSPLPGTTVEEVLECHRIIQPGPNPPNPTKAIPASRRTLNPGRHGEFQVVLTDAPAPLRISNYYRDMAQVGDGKDTKNYVQDKIRSATWLIRRSQRQRTLRKVAESLALPKPFCWVVSSTRRWC